MRRRWRRCTATIEKPAHINTSPMATLQRRSNPVNGSVLAFVSLAGTTLVVAGASLLGVVDVGLLASLDGEVPVVGVVGLWLYLEVGSAATAMPGTASATASMVARTPSRREMPADPLMGNVAVVRDLLEAMTSV